MGIICLLIIDLFLVTNKFVIMYADEWSIWSIFNTSEHVVQGFAKNVQEITLLTICDILNEVYCEFMVYLFYLKHVHLPWIFEWKSLQVMSWFSESLKWGINCFDKRRAYHELYWIHKFTKKSPEIFCGASSLLLFLFKWKYSSQNKQASCTSYNGSNNQEIAIQTL